MLEVPDRGEYEIFFVGVMVKGSLIVLIVMTFMLSWQETLHAQGRQQVKVLVEFQRHADRSQKKVGSSVVVTRKGGVRLSGPLGAANTQTKVQQSTGIFTIVQDGGESTLSVATRVPYRQVVFYHDYATGAGYVTTGVIFQEVGISLKVHATVLAGNQVRVRLTPRISYFSPGGSGAIDFTEASTEILVASGHPVVIGGATTQVHEITRRILGFRKRQTESETSVVLTATIQ